MEERSLERVELIMGAVRKQFPRGRGRRKREASEGALMQERRDFNAETGQRGEEGRRGIWTTWWEDALCMALAHFTIIWAPGGAKITSLLKKWRVTSKELTDVGAIFDSLKKAKYANINTALYTTPYLNVSQACTSLIRMSMVKLAL